MVSLRTCILGKPFDFELSEARFVFQREIFKRTNRNIKMEDKLAI